MCGNFEIQKSFFMQLMQDNPINTITLTLFTKHIPAIFCLWIAMIKLAHFFALSIDSTSKPYSI